MSISVTHKLKYCDNHVGFCTQPLNILVYHLCIITIYLTQFNRQPVQRSPAAVFFNNLCIGIPEAERGFSCVWACDV
jgi:hypothetical protein